MGFMPHALLRWVALLWVLAGGWAEAVEFYDRLQSGFPRLC